MTFNLYTNAVSIRRKKNQILYGNRVGTQDFQIYSQDEGLRSIDVTPITTSSPIETHKQQPKIREEDASVPSINEKELDPKRVRQRKYVKDWYDRKKEGRKSENEKKRKEAEAYFEIYNENRRNRYAKRVERIRHGINSENDLKIIQSALERTKNWKRKQKEQMKMSTNTSSTTTTTMFDREKIWRSNNKDKIRKNYKNWRENNKEKAREMNRLAVRRSRLKKKMMAQTASQKEHQEQPPTS